MKLILPFLLALITEMGMTQTAHRYDILITELMPDPSPPVGLPNAEYIELFNRSGVALSLQQWKISDGSSTAVINSPVIIKPDSFLIVCASSSAALFRGYGTVISVSNFPSLNNEGDRITLSDANGQLIHAVDYQQDWYRNPVKESGGWSLEMIDTRNPCNGSSNWKASTDPQGGSPGRINSVTGLNPDTDPPVLLHSYFIDSLSCILQFNETLDSMQATRTTNYILEGLDQKVVQALPIGPLYTQVLIKWSAPISRNKPYTIRCTEVTDCSGNNISETNEALTGWPVPATEGSLVINEILFNPPPSGADYVEIFNRSESIFDLKDISIASRNSQGQIQSIQVASVGSRLIFPGDHFLFSEDIGWLAQRFTVSAPERILQTNTLPSLPDDEGILLVLSTAGLVLDELHYEEKWHHPLLNDKEAVSLERIDPAAPTQLASNWTSAASNYNYGTPGYLNSQRLTNSSNAGGSINISPKIISPDQDGHDDRARIDFHFDLPDQMASVRIFDSRGRMVRLLKTPHLISASGYWLWNGLSDTGQKVSSGSYIVMVEVIHLSGKVRKYKSVVGVK